MDVAVASGQAAGRSPARPLGLPAITIVEQMFHAENAMSDQNTQIDPVEEAARKLSAMLDEEAPRRRTQARWEKGKQMLLVMSAAMGLAFLAYNGYRPMIEEMMSASPAVAVIPLQGPIAAVGRASADALVPFIREACGTKTIKDIVIEIDSPGGAPVEADRIAVALGQCKQKRPGLKVVAQINSLGASAAYLAALGADEIRADRYGLVGSVGAIIRGVDASGLAQRLGVGETIVASGEVKKGFSMITPANEATAQATQELVERVAATFADEVQASRGERLKATREELLTGRVWTAKEALALGLIDTVGTYEEWLEESHPGEKVRRYKTPKTFGEAIGLESMARTVVQGLGTIEVE